MDRFIRVALLDSQQAFVESFSAQINAHPEMHVVARANSLQSGLDAFLSPQPDIILLDIDIGGHSAFEVGREIKSRDLRTSLILLTSHVSDLSIQQALKLKMRGYLLKSEPISVLIDAIRKVWAGEDSYSEYVRRRLQFDSDQNRYRFDMAHPLADLTSRQFEVLLHLAQGRSVKEVARCMHL
jgi:DNA-binding NarL/FixJ family response regulator